MRNFLCWLGIVLGLALIVALGATVGPCWAATETHDVLVVYPRVSSTSVTYPNNNLIATTNNKLTTLQQVLDYAGTDYVVVNSTQVKGGQLQAGAVTMPGGNVIAFRSVIFFSAFGGTGYVNQTGVGGKVRLDSLTKAVRGGISVPSLFLLDNAGEGGALTRQGGGGSSAWLDSTTGSALNAGVLGTMLVNPGVGIIASKSMPTRVWFGNSYVTGYAPDPDYSRGTRVLLGLHSGDWSGVYNTNNKAALDDPAYALPGAGADTMIVWDLLWDIGTTAKPMTFCKWAGVGYNADSLNNAGEAVSTDLDTEGDHTVLLYGLAHFDSVTAGYQDDGKGLIFKNMKRPFLLSPVIYGLGTRNLRRFQRGILPSDTSIAYATMDSIARLGIPITYAVDPDSAATYPRDVVVAMRGNARFTPQSWTTFGPTGLDSTNIGAATSLAHPVDVFGHFRNRAFYGDSTGHYVMGADSSITTLLIAQRRLLSAIVGRDRLSRCVVAPFDDYSPLKMVHGGAYGSANYVDSLLLAMQRAGYTCLLSDVRYRTGDPAYHPTGAVPLTNPWGWFMQQKMRYNRLTGQEFMVLGYNPQPLMQGERQHSGWGTDSTATGEQGVTTFGVQRAFYSALVTHPHNDYDQQAPPGNTGFTLPAGSATFYSDGYPNIRISAEEWNTAPQHASVIALPFSAISGDPDSPARSGWWTLKWIDNAFANINEAAGQTIIRWSYPEDITR